jgi:hypothetical protein
MRSKPLIAAAVAVISTGTRGLLLTLPPDAWTSHQPVGWLVAALVAEQKSAEHGSAEGRV